MYVILINHKPADNSITFLLLLYNQQNTKKWVCSLTCIPSVGCTTGSVEAKQPQCRIKTWPSSVRSLFQQESNSFKGGSYLWLNYLTVTFLKFKVHTLQSPSQFLHCHLQAIYWPENNRHLFPKMARRGRIICQVWHQIPIFVLSHIHYYINGGRNRQTRILSCRWVMLFLFPPAGFADTADDAW